MAKKVKVTIQNTTDSGMNFHETKEVITGDEFDLFEDYYSYMNGTKKGPHGNSVDGAMIGSNFYVRFANVVDISVEEMVTDEEEGGLNGND